MLRKNLKMLALLVCIFHLSGCASIMSGGPKMLPIMSQPDDASLEIIDVTTGNTISKTKTPYTATLKNSSGFFQSAKYKFKIAKEGYIPYETQIEAIINGWYLGNVIFGGPLGILIIDPATGAMWKIQEDNVNVKLYQNTPEGKMSMATEMYNGKESFDWGDYDKAIEDTTKAISLYPAYLDGYRMRAKCYIEENKIDAALIDMTKVIELKADSPDAYKERADIYILKEEFDKAFLDLDKAIALKADFADALYTRSKLNDKRLVKK